MKKRGLSIVMTKDKKNLYEVLIAVFSGLSMVAVFFATRFGLHPLVTLAIAVPFLIGIPIYMYLPFKYWEYDKRKVPKLSFLSSVLVAWSILTVLDISAATLGFYLNNGVDLVYSINLGLFSIGMTDIFPFFNSTTYIFAALVYAVFNEITKSIYKDKLVIPDDANHNEYKIGGVKEAN